MSFELLKGIVISQRFAKDAQRYAKWSILGLN